MMSVENKQFKLQPAADAREQFAGDFYRIIVWSIRAERSDFVISPVAVQKLLAVVCQGSEPEFVDAFLWDADAEAESMCSAVDGSHPLQFDEQFLSLRQTMRRQALLSFFSKDFTELGDHIIFKNFIVASDEYVIFRKFADLAEDFGVTVMYQETANIGKVHRYFPDYANDGVADVDFLSLVGIDATLKPPFAKVKDELVARGKFKVGELKCRQSTTFRADVLALPLEADVPLTLMLFLTDSKYDFEWLLSQTMGRTLIDYNALLNEMTQEDVEVKLKEFKVEKSTSLADFFRERGPLSKLFSFREQNDIGARLSGIFDNVPENGMKSGGFHQKAWVQVSAKNPAERAVLGEEPCVPRKRYDATDKSYFFVIKSEDVLYFMGHVVEPNFLSKVMSKCLSRP